MRPRNLRGSWLHDWWGRNYKIEEPFESARKVSLESDVKVHAKTTDDSHTPLIWEKSYGKGKFVVDNLGIYERNVRGIYAASYSLLTEATVYPVINGSTYYIDDFHHPFQPEMVVSLNVTMTCLCLNFIPMFGGQTFLNCTKRMVSFIQVWSLKTMRLRQMVKLFNKMI